MKKLYVVRLTLEERRMLKALVNTGRVAASRRKHAQLLLLVDQGEHGPSYIDRAAAEQIGLSRQTVESVRQRCGLEGLDSALERRQRSRERSVVLDGDAEAQLVAIACSEPPKGRARWTLHLLCDELKKRKVVVSVSHESVRQVLKKHHQTLAPGNVVHPAQAGRRLRLCNGASP